MNRRRHRATVPGVIRSSAATCLFGTPRAQASTIALRRTRQDDVAGLQSRLALRQAERGPTGADFNVIGVGADRKHGERPVLRHRQMQWQHACFTLVARARIWALPRLARVPGLVI